jgi:SAM-dependent methyltransferase
MSTPGRIQLEQLLKETGPGFKGLIVNIGGGAFPYRNYFPNCRMINIDLKLAEGIDICATFINSLPLLSSSADVILCTNVLEHVPHPQSLVREMHRVLRPGGSVIHFTPFMFPYHPDPEDYWRFTEKCLEKLIYADFVVEQKKIVGGFPSVLLTYLFQRSFIYRKFIVPFLYRLLCRCDAGSPQWAWGYYLICRKP